MKKTKILKYERTEDEKIRRHRYGDAGATFKGGKKPFLDGCGICPAITTFVQKDIPLVEIYEC